MSCEALAAKIADAYQPPDTGRPSRLTETDTVSILLNAIEAGNYMETACALADLPKETVYQWLKRGQTEHDDHTSPYRIFYDAVKRAEARAEAEAVEDVRKAGKSGPQYWAASMTRLERRHPERWGKRPDEQTGPKVIVQIGVKDSDVQISVLSTSVDQAPTSLAPSLDTLSPPNINELAE